MNILVTGGAGFIGSHLTDALVARGHDVVVFDSLDAQVHPGGKPPAWLNPGARFVHGDVRDLEALARVATEAEVIFHQAAAVGVGQSQYQIKHYVDVNVGGTANLLDVLANRKHRVRKLVVAASMSSYGEGLYRTARGGTFRPALRTAQDVASGRWEPPGPGGEPLLRLPIPETEAQHSTSIYALTKREQEDLVLCFGRTYQVPVVALRYFNAYGARQSMSNPYTGVAAIFLSRLKNDRPPIVYEDGGQTRDFVSVSDIVQANLRAMETSAGDYQSFNVGTGQPIGIAALARLLARLLGKSIEPEIRGEFRKGDVRHCYPDLARIRHALGYEPRVSLEDGLAELARWAREAPAEDRTDKANAELRERGLL